MVKTIRLEDDTYDALVASGRYNETMDDIVKRLLERCGTELVEKNAK